MNFLLPILKPVGLIFWNMLLALLTGPVMKSMIVSLLENAVAKAEKKSKETPDLKDDEDAKMFRAWLEQCRKAWEVKSGDNS